MTELITAFLEKNRIEKPGDLPLLLQTVSAIPWGEGRTIKEVLQTKNVGTCTGKHLVLQECLHTLGIPFRSVACTFHWSEQPISYPSKLREILHEGEWKHGHNFVQLRQGDKWIDIDITWDSFLQSYGFRSFPSHWDGNSFIGIQHILQRWDGISIAEKKRELVASLTPEMSQRREYFLTLLIQWIGAIRRGGSSTQV